MNTHHIRPGANSFGAPTQQELDEVIAYLRERHAGPGLTQFELSIASQLAHTKTLSRKQVDAILSRANLPGPDVVPAGNYAVHTDDGNGETFFIKVWRAKGDPTIARVYVLEGIDDRGTELPARQMLARIIAIGPAKAARDYGRMTTRCSTCARKLTNALSRKLNIGPVCGSRFYDERDWNLIKLEASMWLLKHGINPNDSLPSGIDLDELEAKSPVLGGNAR